MDKARVLETCDEIKRLYELQVRLIEEHNPANRTKIRAVTDQIRKVADRHMEALRANPGAPPPAKRQKGGRRPAGFRVGTRRIPKK